jgi:23S rRNA pseudouridine1911/1915/1917 synthase
MTTAPYRVVFQDEWLLVVDKPAGLAVHAAQGVIGDDLLTLLRSKHPEVTLLHRLDREASGLIIATIRADANPPLQRDLEAHRVERRYTAVVAGQLALRPGQDEIILDRPVSERARGRDALRRKPLPDALPARSRVLPVQALPDATVVEVRLDTGRKHQIRVHLAGIRHPIIGDRRYGGPPAPRMALHAGALAFAHPGDRRRIELTAPLPADLAAMIVELARG